MGLEKLQPIKAKPIAPAGTGKRAKPQGSHVVSYIDFLVRDVLRSGRFAQELHVIARDWRFRVGNFGLKRLEEWYDLEGPVSRVLVF